MTTYKQFVLIKADRKLLGVWLIRPGLENSVGNVLEVSFLSTFKIRRLRFEYQFSVTFPTLMDYSTRFRYADN